MSLSRCSPRAKHAASVVSPPASNTSRSCLSRSRQSQPCARHHAIRAGEPEKRSPISTGLTPAGSRAATLSSAARCSAKPMAPCVFFTCQASGTARPPTRRDTITIWCVALTWLWSMISTSVCTCALARASTSRAKGAITSPVSMSELAKQAADPLVAHVQPLGRARQGGSEFHQVDVTHVQGGRHKESQTFALLLVLPRQARGQVGPNRGRHRLDPAHPHPPAAPNPQLAPQLHGRASALGNLMDGELAEPGSFGSRLFEDGERLVAMFGEVLLALDGTVPPASMDGEGGVSQGGEGLGGGAGSGAAGVLAAGPIADVVQAVLDSPMPSRDVEQGGGVGALARQAGDGVHDLDAVLAAHAAASLDAADLAQTRPLAERGGEALAALQASDLDAPVPLLDRLDPSHVRRGRPLRRGGNPAGRPGRCRLPTSAGCS